MLDKLALTSPETISLETACQQLKGHYRNHTLTGTKYHQTVACFKRGPNKGDTILTLHLGPRFNGISPIKLELNPTRFNSFEDLTGLVSRITDPHQCTVTRIDHTVDLQRVSVQQVHQSLIYSRKKSREVYKNGTDLTGFYLGKNPELLAVYDKAGEQGSPGIVTRIELRQYLGKVPERAFVDLPKLSTYQPFSKLKFQKIIAGLTSPRENQKRLILEEWISKTGAQGGFKGLNRHSNFKRDYQPLLEPDPYIPNLDEIYQANLNQFFKENKE